MKTEISRLLQRIGGGDYNLKRADFELLSDLSRKEMVEFSEAWANASADARIGLISALAQMARDSFEYSFERVFKNALSDSEAKVREQAIRGLWECEDTSLAGRLLVMLREDSDANVRAAAADGLGCFVYLAELEDLEQPLASAIETALLTTAHNPNEDQKVRRGAIEALGFSSSADVAYLLRDAYEDGDAGLRASALIAMGRSADRRWRKIILREVSNPDADIRLEAVRACGELELREAVLPLAQLIERDENLKVRQAAIGALGRAGGPTAKKILELILRTEDGPLYEVAQEAMEELQFADECPEISALLRSIETRSEDDIDDILEEPGDLFEDDDFINEDQDDNFDDEVWDEDIAGSSNYDDYDEDEDDGEDD